MYYFCYFCEAEKVDILGDYMIKFINIVVIIASIVLIGLWLNFFIAREPIPRQIPFLLIVAIVWFTRRFHKSKQTAQAESENEMPNERNDDLDNLFNSFFGNTENWHQQIDNSNTEQNDDLRDLLNSFFGNKEDCQQHIKISRSEAIHGCVKSLSYKIRKYCENCSGTGVGTNGSKIQCAQCNGAGRFTSRTRVIFGVMNSTVACKKCAGAGAVIKEPCQHCKGKGFYETQERQDISIPSGFIEHSITIPNKGHYIDEHARGKLVVTVNHKNTN